MARKAWLSMAVAALIAVPGLAHAQQSEAQQAVRQAIRDNYEYSRENLTNNPATNSADGTLEFWSSGGLLNNVQPGTPAAQYEAFNVTPKYIWIVMLADDQAAMAQYYAEGSYHAVGQDPIDDYVTRVTQIWVNEGGEWKLRGSHFSPLMGGSGISQRSMDTVP